jgi:hypothetical protein
VTRAILLDPEARGARKIDVEVRASAASRPVLDRDDPRARRDDRRIAIRSARPRGRASSSSSIRRPVFNYYPADYVLPGTGIPAPGVRHLHLRGDPESR